jgi:hypothetical protein
MSSSDTELGRAAFTGAVWAVAPCAASTQAITPAAAAKVRRFIGDFPFTKKFPPGDYAAVKEKIVKGMVSPGEKMPPMAAALSADQLDDLAKFVAAGLPQ